MFSQLNKETTILTISKMLPKKINYLIYKVNLEWDKVLQPFKESESPVKEKDYLVTSTSIK